MSSTQVSTAATSPPKPIRPIANFCPTIWGDQSLKDDSETKLILQLKKIEYEQLRRVFQCIFDFFDNKELRFPMVNVFEKFKDVDRKFKSSLINDVQGMLNLGEAAHFAIHGEDILDEALAFTATQLKSVASRVSTHLAEEINHTLKFSIRKSVPRLEARFIMSTYARDDSHNKTLLKFAKLDYNILQLRHRKQLSDILK
ncbi:hypothetical protein Patl1_04377 [Pistacia atlantica]|uniref:Uncharacterized protein n=1 Tax=Pistacia atlantica TaxID=434234 RepID=A0ACC1BU89_9ROSI|nr:hypothetical protein Patl1_04377 [Pistacia atlantica]